MNSETKERVILVVCGVVAAAVAIMLASSGNPGNMAICIACFVRDTAGAMKLQTNETVQYLRPEIIGIIVGACVMAFANKEFKATAGSSPLYPLCPWLCNDDWLPYLLGLPVAHGSAYGGRRP